MKKVLTALCVLSLLLVAGCSKKAEEPKADDVATEPAADEATEETVEEIAEDGEEDYGDEMMTGGWEERVDGEVTPELMGMFKKGVAGTEYENWTPVALLATQVVNGVNFKFLCDNGEELIIHQSLDLEYCVLEEAEPAE